MTLISFICFGIFSVLLVSLFRRDTDIFSPARLFAMVWLFVIGVTDLKLSRFQYDWSFYSWLMLLIAIFGLLTGLFIQYVSNSNKDIVSIENTRTRLINSYINQSLLYKIILIIFGAYLFSFIATYFIEGFIPILSAAPDATRTQWSVFGLALLIQAVPSILYFIVIYFLMIKGHKLKKVSLGLIFLITFLTYLTMLQRFYLILPIIFSIVFIFYGTDKFRLRNILIVLLIIGLIIYGISTIRASKWVVNLLYYISDMKFSVKYAFLTEPYMYIAMNLENFANGVQHLTQFDYGWNTFEFLMSITGLKHWLFDYNSMQEFPGLITNSYNTYTMFFAYYKDFGVIGLGFITLILGNIIGFVYYRMKTKPSINSISFYGVFVFILLFSFFVPILHWLHYIFNTLIIFFVTLIITEEDPTFI